MLDVGVRVTVASGCNNNPVMVDGVNASGTGCCNRSRAARRCSACDRLRSSSSTDLLLVSSTSAGNKSKAAS